GLPVGLALALGDALDHLVPGAICRRPGRSRPPSLGEQLVGAGLVRERGSGPVPDEPLPVADQRVLLDHFGTPVHGALTALLSPCGQLLEELAGIPGLLRLAVPVRAGHEQPRASPGQAHVAGAPLLDEFLGPEGVTEA